MSKELLFKKTVLMLALMLTISSGVHAQLYWSGNQTMVANQIINERIILTGNVTISVASGMATINGIIEGPYSLTKTGGGELLLGGANTYSGATYINGGFLGIGTGYGTGSITSPSVVLNGGGLVFRRSNEYTYSGVISGSSGTVFKYSGGKTILTGVNTYTGATFVQDGTLQIGNGTSGSIQNTSGVTLQNENSVIRFQPGANMYFSKVISGPGKMEYQSTAGKYLYLTANNTYTGTTTVGGTELLLGNNTDAGSVAGNINFFDANGIVTFHRSNGCTYSGIISGPGSVWKSHTNVKVTLTGVNTYEGWTRVDGGTLQIGNGTSGSINNTSGVNLEYANSVIRFQPGANMYFSKVISGLGRLEYESTPGKYLYLTANNTYTGTTTVGGTELALGNGTNAGSVAGNINFIDANGAVSFLRSNEYTYGGIISGPGMVIKYRDNKVILTGANTYTGQTQVQGGTLQIGNGTTAGSNINSTSGVAVSSGATLRFEPGADMTFSKVISGEGNVQYKGTTAKCLYFTANNTYTGTTTIEPSSDFYIGKNTNTGDVRGNIVNNGMLNFSRTGSYLYSGVISGTGGVYVNIYVTGGSVTFGGVNTYTGNTYLYNGSLILNSAGSIAGSSGVVFFNDAAKFNVSAGDKTIKNLSAGSSYPNAEVIITGRKLTIGTSTTVTDGGGTFYGKITGTTGEVTKTGRATLTLAGANTYPGVTTIQAGVLSIGDGSTTTGTVAGNIVNNAGLVFDRSNYTFSGSISGSGYVSHQGDNTTLTLSGALTYTGETRIQRGTLTLSGTTTIASSSGVVFTGNTNTPTLNVSSASRTIKSLNSGTNNSSRVNLGTGTGANVRTLTIGETGQNNGGGTFSGIFTGTGNVTKNGDAAFTMTGANTATGLFNQIEGKVTLGGNWAGNYSKSTLSTLEVKGSASIGGALDLYGGATEMDITTTPPAKLTVTGTVSASGTNTLKVKANSVNNYVLIHAALGITSLTPYRLELTGATGSLSLNAPSQLLLSSVSGIMDLALPDLKIYPNPTAGELKIELGDLRTDRIEIVDLTGRSVGVYDYSQPLSETTINISNLPAGTYFVRMQIGREIATRKVTKQ